MKRVVKDVPGYKVTLLGDAGVGKTSILDRYMNDKFDGPTVSTIGVAFNTKEVWKDSGLVNLEIWDTAGQERYRSLVPLYYRGSHVVLIVYDITDRKSFKNALRWLKDIKEEELEGSKKKPILILIGNKKDDANKREIQFLDAHSEAEKRNIFLIEVSAKTNENIEKLFSHVIDQLPEWIANETTEQIKIVLDQNERHGDHNSCLPESCTIF